MRPKTCSRSAFGGLCNDAQVAFNSTYTKAHFGGNTVDCHNRIWPRSASGCDADLQEDQPRADLTLICRREQREATNPGDQLCDPSHGWNVPDGIIVPT